jgi:hypothetical protein
MMHEICGHDGRPVSMPIAVCIIMMHLTAMATPPKSAAAGITVRLRPQVRERVVELARTEYRSAAAYIGHLVERDLRDRDNAERLVRIHVSASLPDVSMGAVAPEPRETKQRNARRTAVLDTLFGAHNRRSP